MGYAFDHGLIYATAGRAFGHAKAYFDEQLPFIGINNQAHVSGPVWGGGLEYAFTNNWTAKIEYLHVDLGRLEVPQLCFDRCYTDINFETIRLGLNYKF